MTVRDSSQNEYTESNLATYFVRYNIISQIRIVRKKVLHEDLVR